MRTAAFYTLGCKVNQYETELIREQFLAQNYKIVPFSNLADVYVINTCTVTAKSDRKCRYYIQAALRRSPRGKVIVTGCYVNSALTEVAKISPRIIIIPNQEKKNIVKYLLKDAVSPEISVINTFKGHARAFVKIQDGCDAFCAYCIVPYVRNILISRPSGEILSEVHNLVKNGYKEIVLTGIRLGKFRMDEEEDRVQGLGSRVQKNKSDLVRLIKLIHNVDGLQRIRLSSIEPVDVTDELIETIMSLPKLCHHLHIPLQSGDDEVLSAMNRAYSTDQYRQLIDKLKKKIPDINITTDVIVGFPGEKNKNFKNSYDFIRKVDFGKLHVFRFSPRQGTAAARLEKQIDLGTVEKRSKKLLALSGELTEQFYRRFLHKTVEVLLEGRYKKTGFMSGLSGNYIRVLIDDKTLSSGEPVKVKLEKIEDEYACGTVVK